MNSLITRATANRNSPQIKLQLIRFLHRQHTDFDFAYFFFSFFPKPAGRSVERFFKHKEHQFWAIKRAPKSIHNTTIHKKYVYTLIQKASQRLFSVQFNVRSFRFPWSLSFFLMNQKCWKRFRFLFIWAFEGSVSAIQIQPNLLYFILSSFSFLATVASFIMCEMYRSVILFVQIRILILFSLRFPVCVFIVGANSLYVYQFICFVSSRLIFIQHFFIRVIW